MAKAGNGFSDDGKGTVILNAPKQPTTKPEMDVDVNYTPNGTEPPVDGEERTISIIVKYEDPNGIDSIIDRRKLIENQANLASTFFDQQYDKGFQHNVSGLKNQQDKLSSGILSGNEEAQQQSDALQ